MARAICRRLRFKAALQKYRNANRQKFCANSPEKRNDLCEVNHPLYRYRYGIVLGFFLLWMSFFDVNNFVYRYRLGAEIRELEDNISRHKAEIEGLKRQRNELFSSPMNLEKFARERYLMKRDGEDVFVIE